MKPSDFSKAIISTFDAVLDAEKEAGVRNATLNFTATFSSAMCPLCGNHGLPSPLGQMLALRSAMEYPPSVKYAPRNSLPAAYMRRFVNSLNSGYASLSNLQPILSPSGYASSFPGTPFFIGEFHPAHVLEDLDGILKLAADDTTPLMGISFFGFQNSNAESVATGIFALGDRALQNFTIGGHDVTSWCLTAMRYPPRGLYVAEAVAEAFKGRGMDWSQMCKDEAVVIV